MSKEEKKVIKEQKAIYGLEQPGEQLSDEQKIKKQEAIERFERMRKAKS